MTKLWLIPCLTMVLTAADISGKWVGNIEVADDSSGTTINTPVRAEFEQKSDLLAGKIGRSTDNQAESIRNGKVDGKKVLFEVTSPETTGTMKFELSLEGDRMDGEMKGSLDSGPIVGKVRLVRQAAGGASRP